MTTYTYDQGGNLTAIAVEDDEGEVTTKVFGYGGGAANPGWMDQLTKFNGQILTYDAIGNLFNDGASTYHWQKGSQLKGISGAVNAQYEYDYTGLRRSKTTGGVTTNFVWVGGLLMAQIGSDGKTIAWSYDQGGLMLGFTLTQGAETKQYFYLRNVQGDAGITTHCGVGGLAPMCSWILALGFLVPICMLTAITTQSNCVTRRDFLLGKERYIQGRIGRSNI